MQRISIVGENSIDKANACTHAGTFHEDDVFSTVILSYMKPIRLMRVFKVPNNLDPGVIVYDIGGGIYDHHQLDARVREDGLKYAACGLLWADFGREVLRIMGCPENLVEDVWQGLDQRLIRSIDAVDNGVVPDPANINIAQVIDIMNPLWDADEEPDALFLESCKLARVVFERAVKHEIAVAAARTIVEEAVRQALRSSEPHVLVLNHYVPWADHLLNIEEAGDIWYVVFPSNRGGYNVQGVPVQPGSFEQRAPFPKEWRGNPKATGIDDCIFIHATGFLAVCNTLAGAVSLAVLAGDVFKKSRLT